MNKILKLAAIAAMAILGASCAKEIAGTQGGEVNVTISVNQPEGMLTKAFADGTSATKLQWAIYDPSGTIVAGSDETGVVTASSSKTFTITTTLLSGTTYNFLFWADSFGGTDSPYTVDLAAKTLEVNYANVKAGSDAYDAFCLYESKAAASTLTFTLKRPFAQVNVGTTDLEAAEELGFAKTAAKVTFTGKAYTDMNLATGEATNLVDVNLALATTGLSSETFPVANCDYITMAYLLMGTDPTLVDCNINITDQAHPAIDVPVGNVPFRRNYRTNIYGALLTNPTEITVSIDNTFTESEVIELITDVEAANQALAEGSTHVQIESLDGPCTITVPQIYSENTTVVIDLPASEYTVTIVNGPASTGLPAAKIEVNTPASNTGNLVIDCQESTVSVNGTYVTITASTAANTLIVTEDTTAETINILKGNVEVYGTVGTLTLANNCNVKIYGTITTLNLGSTNSAVTYFAVKTAAQLRSIAPICNKIQTVELLADIDLNNEEWDPIGKNSDNPLKFKGTFEGNNHIIRNLKVNQQTPAYQAAGFFGSLNGVARNFTIDGASIASICTGEVSDNGQAVVAGSLYTYGKVENVKVKNATVNGNHYVGGIVGYGYGDVFNCSVENVNLTATPNLVGSEYDNGDKVGGIAGYFPDDNGNQIKDCTAKDVTITAVRDAGGIAGAGYDNNMFRNTAENITFYRDNSLLPSEKRVRMEGIVGYHLGSSLDDSNNATNVSITYLATPSSFGSTIASICTSPAVVKLEPGVYTYSGGKSVYIRNTYRGEGDEFVENEHEAMSAMSYDNLREEMEITILGAGKDKTAIVMSDGNNGVPQSGTNCSILINKASISFKNSTLVYRYYCFADAKVESYENCEIWGHMTPRSETVSFKNCYFNTAEKTSTIEGLNSYAAGSIAAVIYGGYSRYMNFEDCEFHTNQPKAIQIYSSFRNNVPVDITAKNCTLYGGADKKDGLRGFFEVHAEHGIHGTMNLSDCKINEGDKANWAGGVWNLSPFSGPENYFKIIVDGETKKESTWDTSRPENPWTGNYTIQ